MDRFLISKDNAILVIVDIQERLVAAMDHRQRVTANCLHLIEAAKLLNIPMLVTEQYPRGLGLTISEIKTAIPDFSPFEKISFDCCRGSGFSDRVRSMKKKYIILTGMETHVCVLQTCLSLLKDGYFVHLVSDAVCSRKKSDFLTGREMMRNAGAVISCTESVLFQLLERAGSPEFNALSKRIR